MKDWKILNQVEQIEEIIQESHKNPVLIFKHSTTCGISHSALNRIENAFDNLDDSYQMYYLDLLNYRAVSNEVARLLNVIHQSPQVITVKDGKVEQHASHYAIQPNKLIAE